MFGHQNDQKNEDQQPIQDLLSAPALDGVLEDSHTDDFNPALPPSNNQPQPAGPMPTLPLSGSQDDNNSYHDTTPGAQPVDTPVGPAPEPSFSAPTRATEGGDSDLLSIKQQALDQLSPLVDHLEQTPEEKFHTTMMMIQANDNQDLIKVAYEIAQTITDEKIRAKALLDVVNEINYFTQHQSNQTDLLV